MKTLRYIFFIILLTAATTYVYSQSWDMFFDKGKEHYDNGNYEKAIENLELYLKYETANPKAEAKQLLEQAKKRLAEKADTPTNAEQVAKAEITQPAEKPSPKVAEQPSQADKPHEEYFIETALGLNMKMIYVEGGNVISGDDYNIYKIDSYYISEHEITQSQWERVMRTTIYTQSKLAGHSFLLAGEGDDYPMYYVSWEEANAFCEKLSELTGRKYKLPTQDQWAYAASGGKKGHLYTYSGSNNIDEVAWYKGNSQELTHIVGLKQPNELGLYDMNGNVSEWISDRYEDIFSEDETKTIGLGDGEIRVNLGENFLSTSGMNRWGAVSSDRGINVGFRIVCILK